MNLYLSNIFEILSFFPVLPKDFYAERNGRQLKSLVMNWVTEDGKIIGVEYDSETVIVYLLPNIDMFPQSSSEAFSLDDFSSSEIKTKIRKFCDGSTFI